MIEGVDYFVRLIAFPRGAHCHAMVLLNDDGTYSVYLDSRMSADARKRAMRHEYNHMARNDMYGDRNIVDIEEAL